MLLIIILLTLMEFTMPSKQQGQRVDFLQLGNFVCEGKDAGNYSYINPYFTGANCDTLTGSGDEQGYWLTACSPNGQKTVNRLKELASSIFPAGAYYLFEILFLVTSGNLQGKFAYLKEIGMVEPYLKKCSSVLGYSYVMSKSQTLLMADNLELDIFLRPDGPYNRFLKISSTVCQGQSFIV